MTYDNFIDSIIFRLGNRVGLKSHIQREAEIVKVKLEGEDFHPWFLLSEDGYYNTIACESRIPLPDKNIAEFEGGALWIECENGGFAPLAKGELDKLLPYFQCEGMPVAYAYTGEYLRVFPTPDKEYLLRMFFYRGTDLLTNPSNPWLFDGAEWLIWETVAHIAKSTRDLKGWNVYIAEALRAKTALFNRSEERLTANREYNMGEDFSEAQYYLPNDLDRG